MTPVWRYGSISVSFSIIYQYNNYCRGTGGTCNAVIQFNSLTLTMDVECRQKSMSISGFFVSYSEIIFESFSTSCSWGHDS